MGSSLAVPIWITAGFSHGLNMNETTFKKFIDIFIYGGGNKIWKAVSIPYCFMWFRSCLIPGTVGDFQLLPVLRHTHSSERAAITCGLYYYWELVITGADSECSANQSPGQRLGHLVLKPSTDRTWAVIQRLIWIVAITYINVINFHNNPL